MTVGGFRSRDELEQLYGFIEPDDKNHRLLPHRRAVQPHLVRADTSASVSPACATTDGSWTEYGNAVRVPIVAGESPGAVPGPMSMPAPLAEVVSDFAEVPGPGQAQAYCWSSPTICRRCPPTWKRRRWRPVPELPITAVFCTSTRTTRIECGCISGAPAEAPHHPRLRVDPGRRPRRTTRPADISGGAGGLLQPTWVWPP